MIVDQVIRNDFLPVVIIVYSTLHHSSGITLFLE